MEEQNIGEPKESGLSNCKVNRKHVKETKMKIKFEKYKNQYLV